jgi:hypothetical protein
MDTGYETPDDETFPINQGNAPPMQTRPNIVRPIQPNLPIGDLTIVPQFIRANLDSDQPIMFGMLDITDYIHQEMYGGDLLN